MASRSLEDFFFLTDDRRPLAIVRMALGALILVEGLARWRYAVELYSTNGLPMPLFPDRWEPPAFRAETTVVLHSLLLAFQFGVMMGWQTRISLIGAAILGGWLGLLDTPGTFKKYSVIALHLQVLLACGNPSAVWSVDSAIRSKAGFPALPAVRWPRRLIQLLVCFIYFGAAVTKLRQGDLVTGEMLEFVLLDDLWGGRAIGRWLAGRRDLLIYGGLATILFELLFPLLIWHARFRRFCLLAAILFHLLLLITMQLGLFSWFMLTALLAFLEPEDLDILARRFPARWHGVMGPPTVDGAKPRCSFLWGSVAGFGLLIVGGTSASVAIQHHFDWYSTFGRTPPLVFEELSRDEADSIRTSPQPPVSYFVHRLQIGERFGNSRVFGRSTHFVRGSQVCAIARFLQRKPRMKLAWLLISPDGVEVARTENFVEPRDQFATVTFELTRESPVGRYRVVLQLDDYDAAERSIELVDE